MAAEGSRIVKRVAAIVVVIGALIFAIQGGEFTTLDLFRQRTTKARLVESIDSLQKVDDSLRRYEDKLEHDPATQERIAREVFGMVRGNKELLYRFTDSTDSVPKPSRARP